MGIDLSRFNFIRLFFLGFFLTLFHVLKVVFTWWLPTPPKNIRGQLVLITGGSQGIGRALAFRFAEAGCNIAIASRNLSVGTKTAAEIGGKFKDIRVWAFKCDVARAEEVRNLQREIKSTLGTVDILVNNAGLLGVEHSLLEGKDDEAYQRMVDVNLTSYFWTARTFLPDMIRQKRGHVVAISSSQYLDTFPNMVAYCTTKYGNTGFINSLREEMCFYGYDDFIKCTAVHPTFIDTNDEMTKLHNGIFRPHTFMLNDVDRIADLIVQGVLREKFYVNVPCFDVLVCYAHTLMPRAVKTRMVYEALREDTRDQYIEKRRKKLEL